MPRDAKTLKPTKPKKPEVKYLVKHEGPNRAARRRAAAIARIRQKRFETWWRGLERAGIDPKRVLIARKLRESLRKSPQNQPTGNVKADNGVYPSEGEETTSDE